MLDRSFGFIGAGQMARALAGGFARAGLVRPEQIVAFDPEDAAAQQFAAGIANARLLTSNSLVVRAAQVVFVAVKPQTLPAVMQEVGGALNEDQLLVSIAAGISLARLTAGFRTPRVIRVMPNTPCLVGRGASGYALGPGATAADGELVGNLLRAVGTAFAVEERLLDAVTGLSGSGPAFVYMMIEALSDGGVAAGLPRDVATRLAAQMLLGSARMVLETGQHPGALKDMVTSPGGTTIEGLHELEKAGVRGALMNAVRAAAEKSKRLGQS